MSSICSVASIFLLYSSWNNGFNFWWNQYFDYQRITLTVNLLFHIKWCVGGCFQYTLCASPRSSSSLQHACLSKFIWMLSVLAFFVIQFTYVDMSKDWRPQHLILRCRFNLNKASHHTEANQWKRGGETFLWNHCTMNESPCESGFRLE